MDKLKNVLAVIKKHHFWILCGVAIVIGLVVWWLATGGVAAQFSAKKGELEGVFKGLESVISTPDHPNDTVNKAWEDATEQMKTNVLGTWKTLYDQQKQNNKLPSDLSEGFRKQFETLEPDEDLATHYLAEYRDFIGLHLSKLWGKDGLDVRRPKKAEADAAGAEAISRTTPAGTTAPAGAFVSPTPISNNPAPAEASKPIEEVEGIVEWTKADRDRVESRFKWSGTPTTRQILEAQEDLWVYETLVRVIRNTNAGAIDPSKAAIKQIVSMEIGRAAVEGWKILQESVVLGGSAAAAGPSADGAADGRYVDDKGALLAADAQHPYSEFKMMPIRLRLVINQTKIPRLLAECACSPMPIEVRRIIVNPGKGSPSLDPSTAAEATATTGKAVAGAAKNSSAMGDIDVAASATDVPVEIHGVICIYNRPDMEKLGKGTAAAGETPETAPAEAAAPAPAAATSPSPDTSTTPASPAAKPE